MRIEGFLTNEREPKITSYFLTLNDKNIMLDYGAPIKDSIKLKSIDLIFISHSHLDHIYGLINDCLNLRNDTRIITTTTTKRLTLGLLSHGLINTPNIQMKIIRLSKIEELLYDTLYDFIDFKITLYQSGHIFGSAMILLEGEKKIFYTGDINYYPNSKMLSYIIPDNIYADYLIIDGTNVLRNDFKKQSLTHIKKMIETYDKFYINARPEKCVMIAKYLALESNEDKKIYYMGDLEWFLDILIEEGYEPFSNLKIKMDNNNSYKTNNGIYLSSVLFKEYNNDFNIGLHISMNDYISFFSHFNSSVKILLGHFFYKDIDDINLPDYYVLKDGINII